MAEGHERLRDQLMRMGVRFEEPRQGGFSGDIANIGRWSATDFGIVTFDTVLELANRYFTLRTISNALEAVSFRSVGDGRFRNDRGVQEALFWHDSWNGGTFAPGKDSRYALRITQDKRNIRGVSVNRIVISLRLRIDEFQEKVVLFKQAVKAAVDSIDTAKKEITRGIQRQGFSFSEEVSPEGEVFFKLYKEQVQVVERATVGLDGDTYLDMLIPVSQSCDFGNLCHRIGLNGFEYQDADADVVRFESHSTGLALRLVFVRGDETRLDEDHYWLSFSGRLDELSRDVGTIRNIYDVIHEGQYR